MWLFNYSSISHSCSSVLIWFFNVTMKCHVIYIVFVSVVHCHPSLANIIAVIVLYVVPFHSGCFSVCYCNNFIISYNFGDILTTQTQETLNASNQSCSTANKGNWEGNNTGRCQYSMYLQNSVLYNFGIKYFNFQPTDFCSSTLQKTKAVQRTFVLQCS